jgi:ribonuclease BN (tRNA processing enzyme)
LGPEELAEEARFGHASADYAAALGQRAGAARTVLFHHRADRTDTQLDGLSEQFAHRPDVSVAVQGEVIEL